MRVLSVVLLLALLVACASAVNVPYKWCGSSSDDATIQSIVSNEFPPSAGDTLTLNVTGNLSKQVTDGTYLIKIVVDGIIPLPSENASISTFRELPWPTGELNFSYSREIPSAAPAGSYVVTISAVDQDYVQIFCISVAFKLSIDKTGLRRIDTNHAAADSAQDDSSSSERRSRLQQLFDSLPLPTKADGQTHKVRAINRRP